MVTVVAAEVEVVAAAELVSVTAAATAGMVAAVAVIGAAAHHLWLWSYNVSPAGRYYTSDKNFAEAYAA